MAYEMLVCRAAELRRVPLPRPKREGKTAKDKKSGAWAARFANRAARVAWQQDPRSV